MRDFLSIQFPIQSILNPLMMSILNQYLNSEDPLDFKIAMQNYQY